MAELHAFLEAAMDAAEGLPDGAWMAFLESAVECRNREYGTRHDPHATVMAYLESRAKEVG